MVRKDPPLSLRPIIPNDARPAAEIDAEWHAFDDLHIGVPLAHTRVIESDARRGRTAHEGEWRVKNVLVPGPSRPMSGADHERPARFAGQTESLGQAQGH